MNSGGYPTVSIPLWTEFDQGARFTADISHTLAETLGALIKIVYSLYYPQKEKCRHKKNFGRNLSKKKQHTKLDLNAQKNYPWPLQRSRILQIDID